MVKKSLLIFIFIFLFSLNGYPDEVNTEEIFLKSLSPTINYEAVIRVSVKDKSFTSKFIKIDDYEGYVINIGKREVFVVKKDNTIGINTNLEKGSLSFLGLNLPKKHEIILRNYKLNLVGREKLMGREVYYIKLSPICEGNVWEEVWIDTKTYIPLKLTIYDWNDKPLKEKEVISFKIYENTPPILNKMKDILRKNSKKLSKWFNSYEEAENALRTKILKPTYIPCGYELIDIHLSNRFKNTIHIIYSNGIGYISLYVKKVPIWARRRKGLHKGRHLEWEQDGARLLLIGDIIDDELYKMAKSIK